MNDYENMIMKVANTRMGLSPAMRDVVNRVKSAGLHKVASSFYGRELSMPIAAGTLGTKLVKHRYNFDKIASGIAALKELEAAGDVSLRKNASMFNLKTMKKVIPEAAEGAAKKEMPATVGGKAVKDHGDIFANVAQQEEIPEHLARKGLGKTTVRGELPAVKPLEEYHIGMPKPQ